jgi:hypothetical protein
MDQHSVRHYLVTTTYRVERAAEIDCVPQRYSGGDQGEPARAMLQRRDAPVAQLAEAMEADSSCEGIPPDATAMHDVATDRHVRF